MKRLIIAASVALIAGMGTASAANTKSSLNARAEERGPMIQRNVGLDRGLGLDPAQRSGRLGLDPAAPHVNGDLKYGPQADYPQSPPGGGY